MGNLLVFNDTIAGSVKDLFHKHNFCLKQFLYGGETIEEAIEKAEKDECVNFH